MTNISSFVQVRADGNVVPSEITVKEMLDLEWQPSKVIALRWTHNDKIVEVDAPHGTHGIVVPGWNFVAGLFDEDDSGLNNRLTILLPDGSVHGKLENHLSQAGLLEADGHYGWFEPAMTPGVDVFGVVFRTVDESVFRCDIDASGLRLLNATRIL